MAINIADIQLSISANTKKLTKGFTKAKRELSTFGKSLTKFSEQNRFQLAAIGIAGTQAFRQVLTAAGDFEAGMKAVSAITGASEESMIRLTATAKTLGRTTQFSATEAAAGMEFLAKAGFEAEVVMEAIPKALQLAAAASLDLASAADIVTNVMAGFGIEVDQLSQANDVLVKAFTSSNTDLQQLGQAMKFVGPVARGFGQDFEDVVAILGKLGNVGIQASMAGTALRGAMTKLASPSRQAAEILKNVGVQVFDSGGKMRRFIDIIGDLKEGGISTAEVMEVFGLRAGPAVAALLEEGRDSIAKFSDELRDSAGDAARIAAVRMEGFNGWNGEDWGMPDISSVQKWDEESKEGAN